MADPTDAVHRRAMELAAASSSGTEAELAVIEAAGGDRDLVEATRDRLARQMHGNPGDWTAGAALGLCNKSLVRMGWRDPYDWQGRLGGLLRKP